MFAVTYRATTVREWTREAFFRSLLEYRKTDKREKILSGHFRSMDELLTEALQALREKNAPPAPASRARKNLAQFLLESPFAGSDLNLERQQHYGRPIDL